MTNPSTSSKDIVRKISRRNMLRNSAITAAGAALLPPFLTGCRKLWDFPHGNDGHGGGGVGGEEDPLTNFELYSAAQNLLHMNKWIEDLYPFCIEYELYIFSILKSGQKPGGWQDFVLSLFTDIGIGILEAAVDEIPGAGAVIAVAADNIKNWASGERPNNLEAEFAEFARGHNQMQKAISDKLLILADIGDSVNDTDFPYQNLKNAFKNDIHFYGKDYSLRDLAGAQFPTVEHGTPYVNLRTAAYDQFRKYIWNLMFIKAGSMTYSAYWSESQYNYTPSQYARDIFYSQDRYKSTYLRGYYYATSLDYTMRYWYFTFDGLELSPDVAKELFKDDSPDHIINPNGLFNRSYVFKQFHSEKPDFFGYHEFRKDLGWGDGDGDGYGFDVPDDYVFTGGEFPQLTH